MNKRPEYSPASFLLSLFVLVIGLATIASAAIVHLPEEVFDVLPIGILRVTHGLVLTAGLVLVLISQQLRLGKRSAFYAGLILLAVAAGADALVFRSPWQAGLYVAAFLALVANRRAYTGQFSDVDLKHGLLNAALLFFAGLLYGTAGFYFLSENELGRNYGLRDSLIIAANQLLTFSQSAIVPVGRHARWFINSLQAVSATTAILAASALFQPVRFLLNVSQEEVRRARTILRRWSTSTEDFFKLWPPDKHYFFLKGGQSFLAYKVARGVALVLDGPSGNPAQFRQLTEDFLSFATQNGWRSAFIHADPSAMRLGESLGLSATFIGSEAVIEVGDFLETTSRSKHFRYVANRAVRDGLTAELWSHPLSQARVAVLKAISDSWQRGGRSEYTFSMAPFSEEYIGQCDVMVALAGNKPIAYVNLLPSFRGEERTVDHMRFVQEAPSVAMHFLFLELLKELDGHGVKRFNLGLAPLSGIESVSDPRLAERVLALAKRIGRRVYSFEGLESFKRKYEPNWEPRYLVYQGGALGLLQLGPALGSAMAVERSGRRLSVPVLLGMAAGISYLSFLLAPFFVTSTPSIVSDLGAHGQPFAMLFNGADILSGLLCWLVGYLLIRRRSNYSRLWTAAVIAFLLSGLGMIGAAVIRLPASELIRHGALVRHLHTLLSVLDSGGALTSAWLIAAFKKRQRLGWRLAGSMALTMTVLSLLFLGLYDDVVGGTIQRLLISISALWIGLFAVMA